MTKTISLPENTKFLQAKIDWCSSPKINISDLNLSKVIIENSFSSNIVKALLLPLYCITFGKNKYLSIKQVKQDIQKLDNVQIVN